MNFIFDGDIAKDYGIPEAILLHNIAFWVKQNALNKHNCFDGKFWTYNTIKTFVGLFPFLSESTIKRALKHLKDEGLILTGNFSNDKFTHTNYYTLTDKAIEVLTNGHNRKCQNDTIGSVNMTPSIFNKNTNSTDINNTDINNNIPLISPLEKLDLMFEEFWKAYPNRRKYNKRGCRQKYGHIENIETVHAEIMAALEIQIRSNDWTKDNGEFIPSPLVYLNQERWKHVDTRSEKQVIADEGTADFIEDMFGGND